MTQTVLVAGNGGLLFLAAKHSTGLQMDIENFASWAEAARWCFKHRQRLPVLVEGVSLSHRQCSLLHLLTSEPESLPSVHERLCQYETEMHVAAHGKEPRTLPGKVTVRNELQRLEAFFLVYVQRPHTAFSSWFACRTVVGRAMLNQIGGLVEKRAA